MCFSEDQRIGMRGQLLSGCSSICQSAVAGRMFQNMAGHQMQTGPIFNTVLGLSSEGWEKYTGAAYQEA